MKFRMTLIAQKTFDADPKCYPQEIRDDPRKMLMTEISAVEDDPELFLKGTELEIRGEIFDGEDS